MDMRNEETFAAFAKRLSAIESEVPPSPGLRPARVRPLKVAAAAGALVGGLGLAVVGVALLAQLQPPTTNGHLSTVEHSSVVGIPQEEAISIAREHTVLTTFVSATWGPFAGLDRHPDRTGPGNGVAPAHIVWAVEFSGTIAVCGPEPNGSHGPRECDSSRPASVVVFLDFQTGAFLMSQTHSPSPF